MSRWNPARLKNDAGGLRGVIQLLTDWLPNSAGLTASRAMVTDSDGKINVSSITSAQQGYLSGLSGTSSRAVVTDSSGNLDEATTTAAEIGYVSGVTSAIQTQLNTLTTAAAGKWATLYSDETANSDGSGGTEDDLTSYTLPAGTLDTDGQGLLVMAWFSGDATDNTRGKLYVGSGALNLWAGVPIGTAVGAKTCVIVWVRRTSSTTGAFFTARFEASGATFAVRVSKAESITWADSNVVRFTGERLSGSGSANVTQQSMLVVKLP
jgi:hypothetical protein